MFSLYFCVVQSRFRGKTVQTRTYCASAHDRTMPDGPAHDRTMPETHLRTTDLCPRRTCARPNYARDAPAHDRTMPDGPAHDRTMPPTPLDLRTTGWLFRREEDWGRRTYLFLGFFGLRVLRDLLALFNFACSAIFSPTLNRTRRSRSTPKKPRNR